jgi:hypothetical protein
LEIRDQLVDLVVGFTEPPAQDTADGDARDQADQLDHFRTSPLCRTSRSVRKAVCEEAGDSVLQCGFSRCLLTDARMPRIAGRSNFGSTLWEPKLGVRGVGCSGHHRLLFDHGLGGGRTAHE